MSTARLISTVFSIVLAAMGAGRLPSHASEGPGAYPPGLFDLGAGVVPDPGLYLKQFTLTFSGSTRRITEEGKVETRLHNDAFIPAWEFIGVRKANILGSNYGWLLLIPLEDVTLTGDVVRPPAKPGFESHRVALASPLLSPLTLGWHKGRSHQRVSLVAYLPLGSFNERRIVDTGSNRWAVEVDYAYTFKDPRTLREFTAVPGYTFCFENPATHYTSGQEFHIDYAAAQSFPTGLGVGAVAYTWWQTTPDSGPGAKLGAFKGRTFGIGPLITYNTALRNKPVIITAKYYKEFDVVNRFEGSEFWFNVKAEL